MKTTTWKTKCTCCKESVYHYPTNLLLESKKDVDLFTKRIVNLNCGNCNKNITVEFPTDFDRLF